MPCADRADKALELSSKLLALVSDDRTACDHDACLLMNGIVRDCALQIRRTASLRRLELLSGHHGHNHERSE